MPASISSACSPPQLTVFPPSSLFSLGVSVMSQQLDHLEMEEKKDDAGIPASPVAPSDPNTTAVTLTPEPTQPAKVPWKKLLAFTRWSHAWPLIAATVSAGFTAGLKTVLAVVLGKTFDVTANYGSGQRNASESMDEIIKWCIILVALGVGNWLANTAFLALWTTFGELQANSIRHEVFDSLLSRDMTWFDSQEQGISSLLIRIQT